MPKRKYTSILQNLVGRTVDVVMVHILADGPDMYPMVYHGELKSFDEEFLLLEKDTGLSAIRLSDIQAIEEHRLPPNKPSTDDSEDSNVIPFYPEPA